MPGIYEISAKNIKGKVELLDAYKGKVILVVNVASRCGFTPQYKGLEELYQKYKEKGLVILGFPCNQFGHQEPDSEEEIVAFCSCNFGVSFPLFSKIDVNGKEAHPLYKYLKKSLPGLLGKVIKWNFTKFLIDRSGTPFKRFSPITKPAQLDNDISALL